MPNKRDEGVASIMAAEDEKTSEKEILEAAEVETTEAPAERREQEKTYAGMSRRTLCLGAGGAAVLLGMGGLKYVGSTPSVRPPGGQDEDRLLSACIRCEKCLEVCPHDIIKPAPLEYGILGMRTPLLNFHENWCDWCGEENGGSPLCVQACPTQALSLAEDATVENTILGKAVINEDWCLAYRLIGCRFCYDACEYEAMGLDENNRPYVIEDKCNGCGACEAACVSLENGSISSGATTRAIVVNPQLS